MSSGARDEVESERRGRAAVAPAPVPADIGIVAAMPIEVGYLIDNLRRVRKYRSASLTVIEGELGGKIAAIAVGGMGRDAARRTAALLLEGHRPSWMLSIGFAGAMDPGLGRNDLVLPREVIDPEGRRYPTAVPESMGAGVRHSRGTLLTVDRLILDAAEKAELHGASGADLLDMESAAVAALCAEKLVRFLGVRVISDDARTDLPKEVATLLNQSGSYRVGAALRAIWNRPSSIKDFWSLHEHALEAADRLARFVVRCLDELPG